MSRAESEQGSSDSCRTLRGPSSLNNNKNMTQQFALCINNEGYEASLEVGKVYRIIPDEEASAHGFIRIINESGEDYAFGDDRFHRVDLPMPLVRC